MMIQAWLNEKQIAKIQKIFHMAKFFSSCKTGCSDFQSILNVRLADYPQTVIGKKESCCQDVSNDRLGIKHYNALILCT